MNTAAPMRLLLIEDNQDLAANIGEFLESRHHVVDYTSDGLTGLHLAATNSYDVAILDLGLPGLDGVTLCKRLRNDAGSSLPILMLTARDTERDKLIGFEVGADDYLTKPFSLPELHARLLVLQRRSKGGGANIGVPSCGHSLGANAEWLQIVGTLDVSLAQSGIAS